MKKAYISLEEEKEEIFNDQLFIFTETNIKLTDWYIHHNEDFVNYILDSLKEWGNKKIDNWNIDIKKGIYLKNNFVNTPSVELSFYRNEYWAVYVPKEEKIVLFLLNGNLEIDQRVLGKENTIRLVIIHELTHHYDNMFLKGKGINIGDKQTKIKHQKNIEKNAYTKQIIQQMEENIDDIIKEVITKPDFSVNIEFSTILHFSLGKVLKNNVELNDFIQSLDEKTLKKVYKEIGEYFKNRIEKCYSIFNDSLKPIYNKINYNTNQKKLTTI